MSKRELLGDLLDAIMHRNADSVERLISQGAAVNSYEDQYKERPLHFAVTYNAYQCAEALLQHGADMNAKSIEDLSPFEIAEKQNNGRMKELFERYRTH